MQQIKELAKRDLNLLTVFLVLEDERSVTKAAKALGVTQSAVSHSLTRLRSMLGDQLFVKTPGGMVPTPLARDLAPEIKAIFDRLSRHILNPPRFLPSSLKRQFALQTTDFIEVLLLPKLLGSLEREAPQVQVACTSTSFALPKEELEQGTCDLAIAGFFGELPSSFYRQRLFKDDFVCCARKEHPRLRGKARLSLEDFLQERHTLIAPGGELHSSLDKKLGIRKSRFIEVGTASFLSPGWILSESDSLLTAPRKLVQILAKAFALRLFEVPVQIPPIEVVQIWHERNHKDPAHRWFRDCIWRILQRSA